MRALRAVAVSLVGLVLVLGLAWSAPARAGAAEPQAWVAITFTAMSPTLPKRDGTVTLEGTVTNTSKVELSNLQAIFWRSLDPIQDGEGMAAALVSPANEPLGARKAATYQNIPSETNRTLAPKESAPFSLTIPVSALDLPPIDAIYLLGIHVRGRLEPNGPDITLGRGRVFAPIVDTAPANAAQLSTLVVLESRAALVRKGVLADDHLATEIGPEGRLTALLEAADTPDDQLRHRSEPDRGAADHARGLSGAPGRRHHEAGPRARPPARWLTAYTRMAQTHSGFRVLYGHPDVSALVHAGMDVGDRGGRDRRPRP